MCPKQTKQLLVTQNFAVPVVIKKPEKKIQPPIPSPSNAQPETSAKKSTPPEPEITTGDMDSNAGPGQNPPINATIIETTPRYDRNPPPVYPRIARKRGYEGTVLLEVFVQEDGRVGELRSIKSSGFKQLDKSAKKV